MSIDKLKTKFITGAFINDVKHYFSKINEIIDYINGNGKSGDGSYKVYTALLTQSGTDAPTSIILNNTLGITPTWSYIGTGSYRLTSTGTFTEKTFLIISDNNNNGGGGSYNNVNYKFYVNSTDSLNIQTLDFDDNIASFVSEDSILSNTPIEIRVYN